MARPVCSAPPKAPKLRKKHPIGDVQTGTGLTSMFKKLTDEFREMMLQCKILSILAHVHMASGLLPL
jgi:hypothetical protein